MLNELKQKIIKKLGGFIDFDDFLDSEVDYKVKNYILTLAVKKLYNTIGSEDVLKVHDTGQWMFQGRPISEGEKTLLIAEATQLLETKLWQVLQNDIKFQANRKMFLLAENELQITAGKMWLYTLDAFNTRLKSMKSGSALFNNKPNQ